jgi:hypothetical protein
VVNFGDSGVVTDRAADTLLTARLSYDIYTLALHNNETR